MVDAATCRAFTHANGDVTAYTYYGDTDKPRSYVFYFHGLPSSRLEGELFDEAAKRLRVQIIALDRPGVGQSSAKPGRTLLDYPPMVADLAEHLGITQYYVLGTSAGGPYALACARLLASRGLKGTGVVAGVAPISLGLNGMALGQRFAIYATKWMPGAGVKLYDWFIVPSMQGADAATVEKLVQAGMKSMASSDPQLAQQSEAAVRTMTLALREHFHQGTAGLPDEWRNFVSEWGFDLAEIPSSANVHFWCAAKDTLCPIAAGRKMAALVPQAELVEYSDATHHTILIEKSDEMLESLVST